MYNLACGFVHLKYICCQLEKLAIDVAAVVVGTILTNMPEAEASYITMMRTFLE